uniref:enhanced serine sensitivity protein SseB C-terminal domain-containing protein n=1 Tax=Eubacterium cellulosolvens TaxID=29322 RepID=UPI000484453C|nr:enhanced serine sensitivity protein SseB C-terminal domain-containing protein [[Eubacterium] cellulosolvens]
MSELRLHRLDREGQRDQRFTMLAEQSTKLVDGGAAAVGNIRGTVRTGDGVYLYLPDGKITKAMVTSLGKDGDVREELSEERGVVGFADAGVEEIPLFSVISNVEPQLKADPAKTAENAYLRGLIAEFKDLCGKSAFLNLMVGAAAHAHYLVPCAVGERDAEKGTKVSFPSLPSRENENRAVLPVFTDAGALGRWTSLIERADKGQMTTAISFPDVLSVTGVSREGEETIYDGAVINPFGPHTLFLPVDLLRDIYGSPAYQSEFVRGENGVSMKEHRDEQGANNQMLVGRPEENNETKMIREELKKYLSGHAEVKKIWLLEKITPDEEKAYLIVVDVAEEIMRETFEEIYRAVERYAVHVSGVDFARYEKIKESMADILEENEPV